MKKLIVLSLGVLLIAAACNRTEDTTNNTTPPPAATPTPAATPPEATPPTATPTPSPTPSTSGTTISITSTGFSPAQVSVKKGTTVTFVNNDTKLRWPASAPHPAHTDYPAFDPKKGIAAGASWSFTFDKVGTWSFHDHLNPTQFGKVTVTE